MKAIVPGQDESHLPEAVDLLRAAGSIAALTGAGISVESGIPDFRSPGGLWSLFSPDEYATLGVFRRDPAKAWKLYRVLGRTIAGAEPNPAHRALARLEDAGRLDVVVTQNVDGLHQAAGSTNVIEMHGDHQNLQCLLCGWLGPVQPGHLEGEDVPLCPECGSAVKPNVVLFGEDVRGMDTIGEALSRCGLLLVVGTSAQVYPAAGLPAVVQSLGGLIYEFNLEETGLTRGAAFGGWLGLLEGKMMHSACSNFFFRGSASVSLSLLVDAVLS